MFINCPTNFSVFKINKFYIFFIQTCSFCDQINIPKVTETYDKKLRCSGLAYFFMTVMFKITPLQKLPGLWHFKALDLHGQVFQVFYQTYLVINMSQGSSIWLTMPELNSYQGKEQLYQVSQLYHDFVAIGQCWLIFNEAVEMPKLPPHGIQYTCDVSQRSHSYNL